MRSKPDTQLPLGVGKTWDFVKPYLVRGRFSRSVLGSYALQIGSVLLSFLTSILLARLLGPSSFGDYAYALNWALVLSTLTTLGLDKLSVRSVASYSSKEQWSFVKGLVHWSTIRAVLFSFFIMATALLLGRYRLDPSLTITLAIALLLIPLFTLTRIYQGVLRGLNYIVSGQLAETLVRPLFYIILLLISLLTAGQLNAPLAMGLHALAAALSLVMISVMLLYVLRPKTGLLKPATEGKIWWSIAIPLLVSGLLEILNQRASILMLGSLLNTEAVGIYNVAKRLTEPTVFVLVAVNVTLAPRIASYYANDQLQEMQSTVTRSVRLALLVAAPIALIIVLLGPWLLLMWGPAFRAGYSAAIILTLGQLLQAAVGPVILLLNMTDHEREVVIGLAVSTTLTIILNYILIPRFGINGAAIATVIGTLIWNIILAYQVKKLLRIDPTVIGSPIV